MQRTSLMNFILSDQNNEKSKISRKAIQLVCIHWKFIVFY